MDKVNAALIFFTRLPLWKVVNPNKESYNDVVVFWPMVGLLTGGITACVMYGASFIIVWPVAVITAIICRLLMTGALHEDGLADFCDGFGCGGDKDRILSIMKDSHIGTYGVIGLIFYFMLIVSILISLPVSWAVWGIFAADPFSKFCAAQTTNLLPYARPEGAKNKIKYTKMTLCKWLICFIFGISASVIAVYVLGWQLFWAWILPIITLAWLIRLMGKKIGGYTGDCCGASALLCEIAFLISLILIIH